MTYHITYHVQRITRMEAISAAAGMLRAEVRLLALVSAVHVGDGWDVTLRVEE